MQKIASKHIHVRTWIKRLVRRTTYLAKVERMHDGVIGLFVNHDAFGRAI
jgi:IS1 family transposase